MFMLTFNVSRLSLACVVTGASLLASGCGDDPAIQDPFVEGDAGAGGGAAAGGRASGGAFATGGRPAAGGGSASGGASSGGAGAGGAEAAGGAGTGGIDGAGGAASGGAGTGGVDGAGGAASGGAASGGAASGGAASGGAASGGAASGGTSGSGGDGADGGVGDAGPDGSVSTDGSVSADGSVSTDASDAGTPAEGGSMNGLYLVGSTDFSRTEVAAIDLATRTVTARTTVPDGDTGIIASAGRGFLLERTRAKLTTLTAAGAADLVIDLGQVDGGAALNPNDVVVVPGGGDGGAADRAFVPMYEANRVDVFDLSTGARVRSVDLSFLLEAGDSDGSVDVDAGVYVPSEGRVYFLVQRIDVNSVTAATNFTALCPAWPSLVVALDAVTGDVVRLGDSAADVSIPLQLVSPADIELDVAGGRLVITSSGCAEDLGDAGVGSRSRQGIEVVSLSSGTATVAFTPGTSNYFSGTDLFDSTTGVVSSFDAFFTSSVYNVWSIGSPTLGAQLTGVPTAPVVLDADTLIGVRTASGAPPAVVTYSRATGGVRVVLTSPWQGTFTSVSGAALVR